MPKFLVIVKNKSQIHELGKFGVLVYVSPYTNLVALECSEEKISELLACQLVESFEEACTGSL